ncbi:MAG: homoserine kinase [Actinobacteria bacterium]|nr:homoserine kinase [Actinomycetota bacterium]
MRARAPASSANLGPGFDALAVALSVYVEVEVEPAEEFRLTSEPALPQHPPTPDHFAARIAREVLGTDRLAIAIRSDIPLGRGLGSSAALAAATAAAAGAPDPLAVAAAWDGHPENAAASVLGGLVAATVVDGAPAAQRLTLDPEISFVVLVPDRELATKEARAALPAQVPHADAAFNLSRMGILIAGLADHTRLLAAATEDRLHQPPRTVLFPEAPRLLAGLVEGGALASCWSGAGPSLLAICTQAAAPSVQEAGRRLLEDAGIAGITLIAPPDVQGLRVSGGPDPGP